MATSKQSTADRELTMSRLINAPRELVFNAWVDPKHLIHWWGPNGFTNTVHKMEVKPGGVLDFTMHGPDGTHYPNRIVYEQVIKPEKLVYEHAAHTNDDPHRFHVTVTFEARGKKTFLTMHAVWLTVEAFEGVKKFGAMEGGNQTLARLDDYLSKQS